MVELVKIPYRRDICQPLLDTSHASQTHSTLWLLFRYAQKTYHAQCSLHKHARRLSVHKTRNILTVYCLIICTFIRQSR